MVETASDMRAKRNGGEAVHLRPSAPGDPVAQPVSDHAQPVSIRKLRARDLRHLVSNYRLAHVDMPDSLVERGGPLGVGLKGLQPFARLAPITHLAFSTSEQFLAFAQFRQVSPDRRWVVSSVGLANGLFAPVPVVEQLLEFSVVRAGHKGVKRLCARVASDSPLRDAFLRVGFECYMSEQLYASDGAPGLSHGAVSMREQEQTDTWAVHQLYHAAVPNNVQFAEAWTSHQWDVGNPKRNQGIWRSFVLEDGRQIVAYARIKLGAKVASVEVMYLPDSRHLLRDFCRGVIEEATTQGGASRVFVSVRAYQAELMTVLEESGFSMVRQQELMIKYTAVKVVAQPAETVILAPADIRERVPKRVPTFLARRPREKVSA